MIIKRATRRDLPKIVDLLKNVRGDFSEISSGQFLAAKSGNKIIGCVRIKKIKDCLELSSLVVAPEHRGKGVGSKLVRLILSKEKRRPIYLLCFEKTANFYSMLGFEKARASFLPKILREEYLRIKNKLKKLNKNIVAMVICRR